jgi:PAS domain-containing protein
VRFATLKLASPEVGNYQIYREYRECRENSMIDGNEQATEIEITEEIDNPARKHADEILLKAGALQHAILNSANFSSIATDAEGVIQIFNVGAERVLGTPAPMSSTKLLRQTFPIRGK